jgi:hypothetical protein
MHLSKDGRTWCDVLNLEGGRGNVQDVGGLHTHRCDGGNLDIKRRVGSVCGHKGSSCREFQFKSEPVKMRISDNIQDQYDIRSSCCLLVCGFELVEGNVS